MILRNVLNTVSKVIPIKILSSITSQKIILPFYHTISDKSLPHIKNLYEVRGTKTFIQDLEFLCKHFKPIDLDTLYDIISKNVKVNKPVFHITFDDGLKELYSNVAPILKEKGIPATVFLNTDFIDNKGLFFRYKISLIIDNVLRSKTIDQKVYEMLEIPKPSVESLKTKLLELQITDEVLIDEIAKSIHLDFKEYLKYNEPYLNRKEIKELSKCGWKFGSHSKNHPFFKNLTLEEQKKQLTESFNFLSKELNINDRYFSFPFSDEGVEAVFFRWLYQNDCKLSFGISGMKKDAFINHLHRIPFDGINNQANEIIKSEYLYYMIKFFFGKNRIQR